VRGDEFSGCWFHNGAYMETKIPDHVRALYSSLPTEEGRQVTYSICPLCGYPTWQFSRERVAGESGIDLVMNGRQCNNCETFAVRFPDVACHLRQVLRFFAEFHGLR
jgi:hypothetical protein